MAAFVRSEAPRLAAASAVGLAPVSALRDAAAAKFGPNGGSHAVFDEAVRSLNRDGHGRLLSASDARELTPQQQADAVPSGGYQTFSHYEPAAKAQPNPAEAPDTTYERRRAFENRAKERRAQAKMGERVRASVPAGAVVLSLDAAASPPASAIDPPPGMPTERDGVPVYYVRKWIGGARRFTHMGTGEVVDTPAERLSAWRAAFKVRAAKGLYPFVYPRHLETGEQPDARHTLGYVIDMGQAPDGRNYADLQVLGEDGRRAAAANGASVTIVAGQDWDGEAYPEYLHHLAMTPMAAHPDAAYVPTLAASGAVVMAPVYRSSPRAVACRSRALLAPNN